MLVCYVFCIVFDEVVFSMLWGSISDWGKQSLLIILYNEVWGGEKVFQLFEYCLQNLYQCLYLLELLYLCISFGFEGCYWVMYDGCS